MLELLRCRAVRRSRDRSRSPVAPTSDVPDKMHRTRLARRARKRCPARPDDDADALRCVCGRTEPVAPGPLRRRRVPCPTTTDAAALLGPTAALWIPRIVLSPAYLATEYVVRMPLSVVVPAAERANVPTKIYDFFTFGPEHKVGFTPIGFVEFNFNPSVGVYAFWNDAGFAGNHLHLHLEGWPSDWLAGNLVQQIDLTPQRSLQLRVAGVRRPDKVFYGLGPTTQQSAQSRYGLQSFEGSAAYEWRYWRSSRIETVMGLRDVSTYDGHFGSDPSLTGQAATGLFPVPPGFGSEYTAETNQVRVSIDTREAVTHPAPGVSLELGAEQGTDVRTLSGSSWIRYGALAGASFDVNGFGRVVTVSAATSFVDPLGPDAVPFTELVYLGGDHPMPGYYDGRLRDRSAATAAVTYAWPVGPWLAGRLEVDVGNVFGAHLAGFDAGLLRVSEAFGLTLASSRDAPFSEAPLEFVIALGSEPFDHGGQHDSVRIMLGTPHAF